MGKFIACISTIIFIIAFVVGVQFYWMRKEVSYYNNGIHENCGGEWKRKGVDMGKYKFYYECDKCGEIFCANYEMKD